MLDRKHAGSRQPVQPDAGRRAVFLDRDGTLVYPRHYPSHPSHLQLYEGLDLELRRLQTAGGFQLIVITNQSGLARGYFTEADLARLHQHLRGHLEAFAVTLDGIYYCPHHVEGTVPHLAVPCACRKPAPGMVLQAAREHNLDLSRSWFVGDILDDVEAGSRAGTRTVLVDLGTEGPPPFPLRRPDFVARDTVHALRIVQSLERLIPEDVSVDLTYRPASWSRKEPIAAAGALNVPI
jgi:D-glycero-D-manno-heptose 1,7-bisphosphate phosphatase